jgi:hypothetical protein
VIENDPVCRRALRETGLPASSEKKIRSAGNIKKNPVCRQSMRE